MVIVLMGPSGAGKTTVGQALARRLGASFADADDFHPESNIAKMASATPLDDRDRGPWLEAVAGRIREAFERDEALVLACSALKHAHRRVLRSAGPVRFVYLDAPPEVLAERLSGRKGHYFGPALLRSQLEALERPRGALVVDATRPVAELAGAIARELGER